MNRNLWLLLPVALVAAALGWLAMRKPQATVA